QTQPSALTRFLRGEEWLEKATLNVLVHNDTRVCYGDHQILALHDRLVVQGGAFEIDVGRLDGEGATVGHRVSGVHDEVHQHLLELAAIGKRRRHHGREIEHDADAVAGQHAEHA